MGQYKFSIYWNYQIGFLCFYNGYELCFHFPFFTIIIGLTEHASGTNINFVQKWNRLKKTFKF